MGKSTLDLGEKKISNKRLLFLIKFYLAQKFNYRSNKRLLFLIKFYLALVFAQSVDVPNPKYSLRSNKRLRIQVGLFRTVVDCTQEGLRGYSLAFQYLKTKIAGDCHLGV